MIKLSNPYMDEDEINEVRKAIASGFISGTSPVVKEFELMLKRYCRVKNAIATSSCTTALHLACLAADVKPGDEVIVAAYSFPASAYAPMYCGATPVFCDIEEDTFNIDCERIEELITDKTVAVIPVDTFGNPCEIDRIVGIARKHDLFVIEDAACAIGSMYRGKMCGTQADVGCYSFYAIKNMTTGGEGGCCLTNSDEAARFIRSAVDFGKTFPARTFDFLGFNYRLSGIGAAIGKAQLRKLEMFIKRKNELVNYYVKRFDEEDIYWLRPQVSPSNTRHSYQRFVCLVDKPFDRDRLIRFLRRGGIETTIGTYSLPDLPVFGSPGSCPVSTHVFQRAISLPLYYGMTEENIDAIVFSLKMFQKIVEKG